MCADLQREFSRGEGFWGIDMGRGVWYTIIR